jgi:diadenosine tetraphosphate (Ap4A) HIT family hydrolase
LLAPQTERYRPPGHTLIIAGRPVARFQELTSAEKDRLLVWIDWTQEHLALKLSPVPDALNLDLNDGPAAGQTMPHLQADAGGRYPVPQPGITTKREY